eukprot:UN24164
MNIEKDNPNMRDETYTSPTPHSEMYDTNQSSIPEEHELLCCKTRPEQVLWTSVILLVCLGLYVAVFSDFFSDDDDDQESSWSELDLPKIGALIEKAIPISLMGLCYGKEGTECDDNIQKLRNKWFHHESHFNHNFISLDNRIDDLNNKAANNHKQCIDESTIMWSPVLPDVLENINTHLYCIEESNDGSNRLFFGKKYN